MATTIKVNRLELIARLEKRVQEIPVQAEAYTKALAKWKKDHEAWAKKVIKTPANIDYVNEGHSNGVFVYLTKKAYDTMPAKPVAPKITHEWEINRALEELGNLLSLLKIAEGDVVNASFTNKVTQYL